MAYISFRPVEVDGQLWGLKELPKKAHNDDAGWDLCSAETKSLGRGEMSIVRTGVSVLIPRGHVGLVSVRSSIGKQGMMLANAPGIIDAGYTGELMLLIYSTKYHYLRRGDRVAQLTVLRLADVGAVRRSSPDWDIDTERGDGGFGSSGV